MKKKKTKEVVYNLEMNGYLLMRVMNEIHDGFRGLDEETQEKFSEFVYYLNDKFEPSIELGHDIESEELFVKYELSY